MLLLPLDFFIWELEMRWMDGKALGAYSEPHFPPLTTGRKEGRDGLGPDNDVISPPPLRIAGVVV